MTDAIPEKYWHTNSGCHDSPSTKLAVPIVTLAVMVFDLAFKGQRLCDLRSDREVREIYRATYNKVSKEDSDLFWDGAESTQPSSEDDAQDYSPNDDSE